MYIEKDTPFVMIPVPFILRKRNFFFPHIPCKDQLFDCRYESIHLVDEMNALHVIKEVGGPIGRKTKAEVFGQREKKNK